LEFFLEVLAGTGLILGLMEYGLTIYFIGFISNEHS
jgi:hypothetical protein